MAFEGFSEKDYDTYRPPNRGSATFTLARMKVKDKLKALAAELAPRMGEALQGLDAVYSSEAPGLENNRSVAEQAVYWVRGSVHQEAVRALVEKMSLRSSSALDTAAWHKHASLGVVVGEEGVRVVLQLHPRGAVDRRNLHAKLGEGWARDAFVQAVHAMGDAYAVTLPGMTSAVPAVAVDDAQVLEAVKELEGEGPLLAQRSLGRVAGAAETLEAVQQALSALAAVYRFCAWSPEHDHIQAVKQAKQQREEARRATTLNAGDKVRILSGVWAGRQGVVEAVDKKGGLKVQVGAVSVRLEPKDAAPL